MALKNQLNVPISIDSLDHEEITQSVDAGADLVLSISPSNLQTLDSLNTDVGIVAITRSGEGDLIQHYHEIKNRGFHKVIVD